MFRSLFSIRAAVVAAGVFAGVVISNRVAAADDIVQVGSEAALNPNDSLAWSIFGPSVSTPSNPFTVNTAVNGIAVTGATPGSFDTFVEGTNWNGEFNHGDYLLFSNSSTITLQLGTPVAGIGAYIQANLEGNYTGSLDATAFSPGGFNLGTYNVNGTNSLGPEGTAPFLGIQDLSGANISSIVFSSTNAGDGFAIDTLEVSTAVPEPTSLGVLALGLGGLLGRRRRRLA